LSDFISTILFFILLVGCSGTPFAAAPSSAPAQTSYYIDINGNDSNSGTSPSSPWATIGKVNASIFKAGESILFQGGQTFNGALGFTAASWSATALSPVTIGSYGTGRATISSGASTGFTAQNVSGFVLRDLIFIGGGVSGNSLNGIDIENALPGNVKLDYVYLKNIAVSQYGGNGILINGTAGASGFSNVTIDTAIVHDTTGGLVSSDGTAGIILSALPNYGMGATSPAHSDVLITNSQSYNNPGTAGSGNWTGSGIFISNVTRGTIQQSLAYNNGASASGTVGIWAADCTNVIIQFNESHHNQTVNSGADGDGFDLDGGVTSSILQYNYSHDNMGTGYLLYTYADAQVNTTSNITARYNISQNDNTDANNYYGGITIGNDGGTLTGVNVYNNTVYQGGGAGKSAISITGSSGNAITGRVANNIFYAANSALLVFANGVSPANLLFTGNDYFSTGAFDIFWGATAFSSLSAWQTATGQEKMAGNNVGLNVDPKLTSAGTSGTSNGYNISSLLGYELQHASPVIGSGINLENAFGISDGGQDYFGDSAPNGVGSGYNMGADGGAR
jgi:hypothetical protein